MPSIIKKGAYWYAVTRTPSGLRRMINTRIPHGSMGSRPDNSKEQREENQRKALQLAVQLEQLARNLHQDQQ